MKRKMPALCFIAHNAFGVLARNDNGHAGGIEIQVPLMARWFAAHGYPVSMICWDEGFVDGATVDGVKVFKLCKKNDGLPGLRFFHPRWSSFNAALRRADADIYYYNCGDLGLGQLVWWARNNNKKVIYSVANKTDCQRDLPGLKKLRERVMYRYGLQRADHIVAQTREQAALLDTEYGLAATVIPMPSAGFGRPEESAWVQRFAGKRVLWIGRWAEEKRLEWLLDLAQMCPSLPFDVVGAANAPTPYSKALLTRAADISNVTLHGRLPHERMGELYRQAALLCSTSIYEGFPNVFLEAWSTGLPLVTTFDPDGVVAKHNLGAVAGSQQELREQCMRLLGNYEEWRPTSMRVHDYFSDRHGVESSMEKFAELFAYCGNH